MDDTRSRRTRFDGNLFKEDTGPECSLGIKRVVYEAGGRLILLRMGPVGHCWVQCNELLN